MSGQNLRTPLSAVVSYMSMLQDGTLDPEHWTGPIQTLTLKAIELNKIVNDLMMAARLETADLPSNVASVDLSDMVREAITRAEPRAALMQAHVTSKFPRHPVLVEADPEHVGRILDALINNALTYSAGTPRVTLTVSNSMNPQVAVEDRGIGIPSDVRERIFERFFRMEHAALNAPPGTGLGLYIGQVLAERSGGSLLLERSEEGRGSRFVLRLPAAVATAPLKEAEASVPTSTRSLV